MVIAGSDIIRACAQSHLSVVAKPLPRVQTSVPIGIEERVRLCLLDEGSAGSLRVRRGHENLVLSVRTHLISLEAAPRPAEMRMQRE